MRAAQTACIVDLQLLALCHLIREEEAGEEFKEIFLVGLVAQRGILLLPIVIAFGVHLPVFATQAGHDSQLPEFHGGGGIERMDVDVVDESVVVFLVFSPVVAIP